MTPETKRVAGVAGLVGVVSIVGTALLVSPPPASKGVPPSTSPVATLAPLPSPCPTCAVSTVPTEVVAFPTPTVPASATATPSRETGGACTATLTATLTSPGGKSPTGYADSIAITGNRLLVREAYGISSYTLSANPQYLGTLDLEATHRRVGDGQHTVTGVGASADGSRIVAGWNVSEYGNLILDGNGRDVAEWTPQRPLGGLGVVTVGGRLVALGLTAQGLFAAPLDGPVTVVSPTRRRVASVKVGPPGNERSLSVSGSRAAYVTPRGDLISLTDATSTTTIPLGATAVALEGDGTAVAVAGGYRLLPDAVVPLPETTQVIALVRGRVWCALSDGLYADGKLALAFAVSPRVLRGSGDLLFLGDSMSVRVFRTVCQ